MKLITLALLVVSSSLLASVSTTIAQEDVPDIQRWEFGLEIQGNGNATGIIATVPIPVEWPEQSLTLVEEKKSDLVSKLSFKKFGNEARQLVIKINRIQAGQTVRATIVYDIEKKNIAEPESPGDLRFATKKETRRFSKYLNPSPYIESNHRRIKDLAESIELDADDSPYEQVKTIFDWVRDNIKYEFDTTIRTCLEAIDRKQGDCEEMSSLFIAICRAKGIPARAVWIPDHTYPEFYLVDKADQGQWLPCQPAGMYEFGSMTETKPILQKGDNFKLPGYPKALRYAQPTLKARDAAVGPTIKWIMTKVETGETDK